jgi:hypothetical protein
MPAAASATSTVSVTNPPDGKTYYTGSSFTATIPVAATLSSTCDAGNWYIRRNEVGKPRGPYTAGGSVSTTSLSATNYLPAGDYEYSGYVDCVSPEGDGYTTNFSVIHVVAGDPPDQTAPTATLSGSKRQTLGKNVSVKLKSNEAGTATGTGTLNVPNASKVYRLEKASTDLIAGDVAKLKLKLSRAGRKAARTALENGTKVKAHLKIVTKDAAGNKTTKERTVKLTLDG